MSAPLRTCIFFDRTQTWTLFRRTFLEWRWTCTLFSDKMQMESICGDERYSFSFDFKNCDDSPERGIETLHLPLNLHLLVILLAGGGLTMGIAGLLVFLTDRFLLHGNYQLVSALVLLVVYYGGSFVWIRPFLRRFRKRLRRRYATFQHFSSKSPYFTLAIAKAEPTDYIEFILYSRRGERWKENRPMEPLDEFESFIADLCAAIKRLRQDPNITTGEDKFTEEL